jgi:hypothetical protein
MTFLRWLYRLSYLEWGEEMLLRASEMDVIFERLSIDLISDELFD